MIFSILILAIVGGVAYFHYAQGFLSATMSAMIAVIAAALAISLHEPIVSSLLKGKFSDYAHGLALIAIFAAVYMILRVLVDKAVPGQVRLPVIVDRIGGAAMGLIAGIFTAGIFALAAQAMPFGPSIGGYSRYVMEKEERSVNLIPPGEQRARDMSIGDQMKDDRFEPGGALLLIIPVDNMVLGIVDKLSDGGSLAGERTLSSVHPNYADELFAQRLGIQLGAKHTTAAQPGFSEVTIPETPADPGVYTTANPQDLFKGPAQTDSEIPQIHQRPVVIKPERGSDFPLIVRVMFGKDAADSDGMVRFSPGSIRLVANRKNYWPVGNLENGKLLYATKVDDYLLVKTQDKDRGIDLVFLVDPANVVTSGDPKAKEYKINDGVFIEVKRLSRIDLGGRKLRIGVPPSKDVEVYRKPAVVKKEGAPGASDAAAKPAAPFVYKSIAVNKKLFSPINVGTPDKDVKSATLPSGTISLASRQFTQLDINTTQTVVVMRQGSYTVDELAEPTGQKVVQVTGTPPAEGADAWAWADNLSNFAVVDAADKAYAPVGAFTKIKKGTADFMIAKYAINGQAPSITKEEGRPMDVYLVFLVPSGTHLKALNYNSAQLQVISTDVP